MDASLRVRVRFSLLYAAILAVLILGSYPAIRGISESVLKYHFGPPNYFSVTSSAEANPRQIVLQRLGDDQSYFYLYFGK